MRKGLLAILIAVMIVPSICFAQKAGSFIAGFDIGMTSAIGDFRDDTTLNATSGINLGGEIRYTLFNNLSLGPFIKYQRFGSSEQNTAGNISYNLNQYGCIARFNMFDIRNGRAYILGGGGIFRPTEHTWAPDYIIDKPFESSTFLTGGIGICTNPFSTTIFEFELRYSTGDADRQASEGGTTHSFDFISFAVKISFNSKGIQPPPRY